MLFGLRHVLPLIYRVSQRLFIVRRSGFFSIQYERMSQDFQRQHWVNKFRFIDALFKKLWQTQSALAVTISVLFLAVDRDYSSYGKINTHVFQLLLTLINEWFVEDHREVRDFWNPIVFTVSNCFGQFLSAAVYGFTTYEAINDWTWIWWQGNFNWTWSATFSFCLVFKFYQTWPWEEF